MYGQSLCCFPALDCANAEAEIRSNFLPGLQALITGELWNTVSHDLTP
jgi:hypothetical protein